MIPALQWWKHYQLAREARKHNICPKHAEVLTHRTLGDRCHVRCLKCGLVLKDTMTSEETMTPDTSAYFAKQKAIIAGLKR